MEDKYQMIDIDSDDFYNAIMHFYKKCKRDRDEHDIDLKGKTTAERIELHEALYKKQERYANDLFNDITKHKVECDEEN